MTGPIVLDISRLLSRAARRVPTGIDRVEHAYAEGLLRLHRDRLRYAALHPLGKFGALPTARARRFVDRIGAEWTDEVPAGEDAKTLAWRLQATMLLPRMASRPAGRGRATYLLVSHHHLHQPEAIVAARRKLGAAFVCAVQDLIPIEYPEFGRPQEDAKHRRRMETVARYADGIILPSIATRDAILPFIRAAGRDVPMLVSPLGVHEPPPAPPFAPPFASTPPAAERPYFLYISTIEPRKNHLLLLHVWRRLVLETGPATPRLVLVGQRGWENEMVLDVLERSELLREHVVECNALPDREVRSLIAGARAVLMPSFVEGYGLPLAEALAAGTPALCSDIPALREVGGDAPEFLDPLDGPAWATAIRDYTRPDSPRRAAQLQRVAAWRRPEWDRHLEDVMGLIDDPAVARER